MSSFFPHDTQSQYDQHKTAKAAEKPGPQAVANNQPQPKKQNAAPMQMTVPAHRNTPMDKCMQSIQEISLWKMKRQRHEVGFAHEVLA